MPGVELTGRTLGEFTVREPIGTGGFAVVHRAEQRALEREAVVKVLHARLAARPEVAARFLREARLASRIEHPYAAHVYAFGAEPDGVHWIAMELVRGTPMDELLATGGPLPPDRLAPLFARICEVVQDAHDRGIVHRDLKPGNVMVIERGGRLLPKLLDFGLARALDDDGGVEPAGDGASGALDVTAPWSEPAGATGRGRAMGSPAYMAPEQWIDAASVGPATDVYALGVLAYQALTGAVPFTGSIAEVRRAHLEDAPPAMGTRFDAVIARALAKRPADRFPSAAALAAALTAAAAAPVPHDDAEPYRGLAPFTEADAADYVGREGEIEAVVERLLGEPVVAVVGASGAGKSSFVRAGVVPHLPAGWRAIVVRPGPAPLATLEGQLQAAGVDARGLRGDPSALGAALRAGAAREHTTLVLAVDQLEELFTHGAGDGERAAYAAALAGAATSELAGVRVIATLRDDFLVRAGALPGLGPHLIRGLTLLATPAPADLVRIVTAPAARAGYRLDEAALAGEMVAAVADQPGALALLSFTAAALWQRRDRTAHTLTRAAYDELGGVAGALAGHAEATLDALPAEDQHLVRLAFRQLVTVDGARQVVAAAELQQGLGGGPRAQAVIDRLIAARLLVSSEDRGGAARVEIVHEALAGAWPRLVGWRREDADGARLRDQLVSAARQWDARERPRGLLWRDDALAELRRWQRRHPQPLPEFAAAFAAASVAAATRGRRLRRALVIGAFAVLAIGAAVLFELRAQAGAQRRLAEARASTIAERLDESNLLRGQQALLAGDFPTALDALGRIVRPGAAEPAMRFMQARAAEPTAAALVRFESGTTFASWNADGTRLVDAGNRAIVYLRDGEGRVVAELPGHDPGGVMPAWRPDGQELATLDYAGTLRLWTRDGALTRVVPGVAADDIPIRPQYSPDGTRLIVIQGGLNILDPATGARLVSWDADPAGLFSVTFTPDGAHLITCGGSGAILWTLAGERVRTLRGHTAATGAAEVVDDRIITISYDSTARIWDAVTGEQLHILRHDGRVTDLAIDPSAELVATAGAEPVIRIWRIADGSQVGILRGHTGPVSRITWTRDGQLVSASTDGTARVWDPGRGVATAVYFQGGRIGEASLDPSQRRLITVSRASAATIWDLSRQARLATLSEPAAAGSHRRGMSPLIAGTRLVRAGSHGVAGWDLAAPVAPWTVPFAVTAFDLAMDGATAIAASADGVLHVLDAATGRERRTVATGGPVVSVALDPALDQALTCGPDGTVAIWDLATGTRLHARTFAGVDGVSYLADGRVFLGAYRNPAPDATSWFTDRTLASPSPIVHIGGMNVVRSSADGHRLAIAPWSGDVELWSASGERLATLPGTSATAKLAWSPDGRRLITTGSAATLAVWDPATGTRLAEREGHSLSITAIEFDPAGALFATSSVDRTVRVWSLDRLLLLHQLDTGSAYASDVAFVGDTLVVSTASQTDVWRAGR